MPGESRRLNRPFRFEMTSTAVPGTGRPPVVRRETEKRADGYVCHGLHAGPESLTGPGQPNEICVVPLSVPVEAAACPGCPVSRTITATSVETLSLFIASSAYPRASAQSRGRQRTPSRPSSLTLLSRSRLRLATLRRPTLDRAGLRGPAGGQTDLDTFDVRVDVVRRADLAERFRVAVVPTIVVIESNRVKGRLERPRGNTAIAEFLAQWLLPSRASG